jgi:hypothetical protein
MEVAMHDVKMSHRELIAAIMAYNNALNRPTYVMFTAAWLPASSAVSVTLVVLGYTDSLIEHANGEQSLVQTDQLAAWGSSVRPGHDPHRAEFTCFGCGFTVKGDRDTRDAAHLKHDGAHEANWYRESDGMFEHAIPTPIAT